MQEGIFGRDVLQILALLASGERQGGRTKPILDPSGGDF